MRGNRQASTVRRPVILAAISLVLAAALLVALRFWLEQPDEQSDIDGEAVVVAEAEPVEPTFELTPIHELVVAASPSPEPAPVPIPVVAPPVPMTVIMLPVRVASSEPEAAFVTEQVRQSTLRALRAMPDMVVTEIGPAEYAAIVPANAGPLGTDNLVYLAVTSRHEGRVVAEISEQTAAGSQYWVLSLLVGRPNGGGASGGNISKNNDPRMSDAESLGVRYADRIARDARRVASESNAVASSSTAAADARNAFLDVTRSESQRMQSLTQLVNEGELDSATIAAAVDMAMRSASAQIRRSVWSILRRSTFDLTLAQPLSYALLSEVDAAVRKEAALALAAYAGDTAAAAALAYASRYDSSSEVRLAAQMSAMDFDEQQAFKRQTLLDRSLTPAERLAPTIVGDNMRLLGLDSRSGTDTTEEALAYAEIVVAVEDPELKIRGLSELENSMMFGVMARMPGRSDANDANDAKIVEALIETSRHANSRVRRQALTVLRSVTQMSGNAQGRAALEAVLENEPELADELNIPEALEAAARQPLQLAPAR